MQEGIQLFSHAGCVVVVETTEHVYLMRPPLAPIGPFKPLKRMQSFGVWQGLSGLGQFGLSSFLFKLKGRLGFHVIVPYLGLAANSSLYWPILGLLFFLI
jgi:hypothetical protein